jgi:hypothetical protein
MPSGIFIPFEISFHDSLDFPFELGGPSRVCLSTLRSHWICTCPHVLIEENCVLSLDISLWLAL